MGDVRNLKGPLSIGDTNIFAASMSHKEARHVLAKLHRSTTNLLLISAVAAPGESYVETPTKAARQRAMLPDSTDPTREDHQQQFRHEFVSLRVCESRPANAGISVTLDVEAKRAVHRIGGQSA